MAVINAPSEGPAGELITFDGSESTSDVEIVSYQWDFGDGSDPAEGEAVEHAYQEAGTYEVVLTITDANNQTATASMQITIQ